MSVFLRDRENKRLLGRGAHTYFKEVLAGRIE